MLWQQRHGPNIKSQTLREYDTGKGDTQTIWDNIKWDHLEQFVKDNIKLGFWERVRGEFNSVQGRNEFRNNTQTPKLEAAYSYKTSATQPTFPRWEYRRAGRTLTMSHRDNHLFHGLGRHNAEFPFRINHKLRLFQTFGRTPWAGDQPFARRYLHRTTQTQK
jgi:hypothetical protein